MLRKLTPYLLFALLGVLFVVLKPAYQTAFAWFYHAAPLSATGNATGAQIEAAQASGGWVPSGSVASKFIVAAAAYLLFALLPWVVQRLTHPVPTAWAKGPATGPVTEDNSYSEAFRQLPFTEKFTVYGRLQLVNVIRAAAALVFAALVV